MYSISARLAVIASLMLACCQLHAEDRVERMVQFGEMLSSGPKRVLRQVHSSRVSEAEVRVIVSEISWKPLQLRQFFLVVPNLDQDPLTLLESDAVVEGAWFSPAGVSVWDKKQKAWLAGHSSLQFQRVENIVQAAHVDFLELKYVPEALAERLAALDGTAEVSEDLGSGNKVHLRIAGGWIQNIELQSQGQTRVRTTNEFADGFLPLGSAAVRAPVFGRGEMMTENSFGPVLNEQIRKNLSIGMGFTRKDLIVVNDVAWGSQSYAAGIRRGDFLLAVNGIDVLKQQEQAIAVMKTANELTLDVLKPTGKKETVRCSKQEIGSYVGTTGRLLLIKSDTNAERPVRGASLGNGACCGAK